MDDGHNEAFRARSKEKSSNATLTIDPEKLRLVWDRELRLKVYSSIWTDPEEVNARFPETFQRSETEGLGSVRAPTNLFARA